MNPRSQSNKPLPAPRLSTDDIEEIAADWIARRNGCGLSAGEQTDLNNWLDADPRHAQAFQTMESAWGMLNAPRRAGRADAVWTQMAVRARRRRNRMLTSAGAVALLVFAFVGPGMSRWSSAPEASFAVRPDVRTLPDGSTVELNLGAEISVEFTPEVRGIQLVRGEALFDVVNDATRPFVVTAGTVVVRAVGTSFTVRHETKRINVLVVEGTVAVDRAAETPQSTTAPLPREKPVYLDMGRQLAVPVDVADAAPVEIRTVSTSEMAAALAWRDNRIEFADTPLSDAVRLFNRRNRIQLAIESPSLVQRSITGVFWADDPEGFVRLLESAFPINSKRTGDSIVLRSE